MPGATAAAVLLCLLSASPAATSPAAPKGVPPPRAAPATAAVSTAAAASHAPAWGATVAPGTTRIAVIGDYGDNSPNAHAVTHLVKQWEAQSPLDAVVSLGGDARSRGPPGGSFLLESI